MEKIDVRSFIRRDKKGKTSRVSAAKRALKNKQPKKVGKLLGEGKNGRVFELKGNKVYKERTPAGQVKGALRSVLGADETGIQKRAAKIGVAPKVISSGPKDKWVVMEKINGESLSKKLPKLDESKQKSIGIKTGKNLKKLHQNRIVHNDTHLDNLYATKRGEVKILDYGLSRYKTKPLSRNDKLKDYKKLSTRAKQYPSFIEGVNKGYGEF